MSTDTEFLFNDKRAEVVAVGGKQTGKTYSVKQRAILHYLTINKTITLKQAVELVGKGIYTNEAFHVGAILSRMVTNGAIVRVRKGVFTLPA